MIGSLLTVCFARSIFAGLWLIYVHVLPCRLHLSLKALIWHSTMEEQGIDSNTPNSPSVHRWFVSSNYVQFNEKFKSFILVCFSLPSTSTASVLGTNFDSFCMPPTVPCIQKACILEHPSTTRMQLRVTWFQIICDLPKTSRNPSLCVVVYDIDDFFNGFDKRIIVLTWNKWFSTKLNRHM